MVSPRNILHVAMTFQPMTSAFSVFTEILFFFLLFLPLCTFQSLVFGIQIDFTSLETLQYVCLRRFRGLGFVVHGYWKSASRHLLARIQDLALFG